MDALMNAIWGTPVTPPADPPVQGEEEAFELVDATDNVPEARDEDSEAIPDATANPDDDVDETTLEIPAPRLIRVSLTEADNESGIHTPLLRHVVNGLIKGSPAYRAGVQLGDRIFYVNETNIGNMSRDKVSKLIDIPGKTYEVLVLQEDEVKVYEDLEIPISPGLPNIIRIAPSETDQASEADSSTVHLIIHSDSNATVTSLLRKKAAPSEFTLTIIPKKEKKVKRGEEELDRWMRSSLTSIFLTYLEFFAAFYQFAMLERPLWQHAEQLCMYSSILPFVFLAASSSYHRLIFGKSMINLCWMMIAFYVGFYKTAVYRLVSLLTDCARYEDWNRFNARVAPLREAAEELKKAVREYEREMGLDNLHED